MKKLFRSLARTTAGAMGSPTAFLLALLFCVGWGACGPLFHYSDSWQLVANTVTNVVTFLMVFLIQYAQNRDTQALQLKLDEVLRTQRGARGSMLALEELSDAELEQLEQEMRALRDRARRDSP
jgi:low affinity Fe/Cu permease